MLEKHQRSVLKGITWRVIGTLDTIFLSWLFTGSVNIALTIGGVEVFTKIFLFYLHERLWLRLSFGKRTVRPGDPPLTRQEKHYRSMIKGISWRIWGTIDTIVIAFFVTGDYTKAFTIGFAEVFTKVLLFYAHERVWQRIGFGRKPDPVATQPQLFSKLEPLDESAGLVKEPVG